MGIEVKPVATANDLKRTAEALDYIISTFQKLNFPVSDFQKASFSLALLDTIKAGVEKEVESKNEEPTNV